MKPFIYVAALLAIFSPPPAIEAGSSAIASRRSQLPFVTQSLPRIGQPAPRFRLTDAAGRKRSLAEFRGRRVALFVFCGCSWCAGVARQWGEAQRGGALSAAGSGASIADAPPTLVVGSHLEAKGCRALAARARLDPAQTVLLPDPDGTIAEMYHADPCPRVFVIAADGTLLYVNRGKADAPRKASAATIVAHALQALRGP